MSKAFLGPRPSTTFRSPGSMGFNKVICMLALLLPFFGTATQQARAYPVGEPIGTTGPLVGATLTFTASGTLSSIAVLTQGAPNLDFKFVSGGTCATGTAYTTGQTCTVSFTFTPTLPGPRYGGITLTSAAGTLLGSTYIYGIGMGPQANFSPATQTIINTNVDRAVGVVFDGFGNLFVGSEFTGLLELTAASGYNSVINLNNTFVDPIGIAIDGNGNLFVVDHASNTVTELFAGTGYTTTSAISSGLKIENVALDGTGNIFGADFFDHTIVKFDFADAPTLTFSPTNIGQVSTDSPQIVTLFNNGNQNHDLPSLPSAPHPSITPGFTIAGNSSCP